MKDRITEQDVHSYVAECAESIIEDDFDEGGLYTQEAFEEIQRRARRLMKQMHTHCLYDTKER